MSPADLISYNELADVLGVSRSTAGRYARREDFPAPYAELATGRVWKRAAVVKWKRENLPMRRGRPPAR